MFPLLRLAAEARPRLGLQSPAGYGMTAGFTDPECARLIRAEASSIVRNYLPSLWRNWI